MNTPNKGDILAKNIETILDQNLIVPALSIRDAIAKYRDPWTLGRTVNGFTLAEGQEWRWPEIWTEENLAGCRPFIVGEVEQTGDEFGNMHPPYDEWMKIIEGTYNEPDHHVYQRPRRTRRPLPVVAKPVLTPEQIAEGWLEWHGGECPVWGGSRPKVMFRDNNIGYGTTKAKQLHWHHAVCNSDIIAYLPDPYEALKKAHSEGKVIQWKYPSRTEWITCTEKTAPAWLNSLEYRIKPEPVMVPLGPEDVKCGDMLRNPNMIPNVIALGINEICNQGVNCGGGGRYRTFLVMFLDGDEISRDGGKTWQKCEKEGK